MQKLCSSPTGILLLSYCHWATYIGQSTGIFRLLASSYWFSSCLFFLTSSHSNDTSLQKASARPLDRNIQTLVTLTLEVDGPERATKLQHTGRFCSATHCTTVPEKKRCVQYTPSTRVSVPTENASALARILVVRERKVERQ